MAGTGDGGSKRANLSPEQQALGREARRKRSLPDTLVRAAGEPERVERVLQRDRQDARAERKRAAAEIEVAAGRFVNINDAAIRPTPEQLAKGDYREVVVEKGKGHVRNVTALKNRGGTAVERWFARGDLSRGQAEAIALYARAWRLRYEFRGHTAMSWSLAPGPRGGTISFEELVSDQHGAKQLLDHLDSVVFFAFPLHYFEVWKRVVIEDEAAGVAGSRLGFTSKQAESAAKSIVLFIADMIATDMRLGDAA